MSTETVTYLLKLRDKFSRGMETANKQTAQLDKGAAAASVNIARVGAALGALGVFAAGKAILQAGMNMEQTRVAFATFLGDANKANNVIAQLNQFSNITPFNNDEVIKSGRVLLAAQLPAEKLTETLRKIGDVAAGSQVPLNELTSIYAKILNKGKVQAEELNQLSERGIPILKVLADQYGVTTQEILEMGSEGKLTADVVGKAFSTMSNEGGIFFNLMEKQSATAAGKLSTLQGSLGLLAAELGERANPAVGDILGSLIELVNLLKDNQETVIKVAKTVALMTTAFLAYKVTIIATRKATLIFNAVQKATVITNILFTKGLKKARVAMRLFNVTAKANPIGLIVSGLVLAIPLILRFMRGTEQLSAKQKKLNEITNKFNKNLSDETVEVKTLFTLLKASNPHSQQRADLIKKINEKHGTTIKNLKDESKFVKQLDEAYISIVKNIKKKLFLEAQTERINELVKEETAGVTLLSLARKNLADLEKRQFGGGVDFRILEAARKKVEGLKKTIEGVRESQKRILQTPVEDEVSKKVKDSPIADLDKTTKKTLETGIRAGAPKIINININNLVENFEIKTEQFREAPIRVKEEMTKVLLDSINDAALLQR